jgi:hypothetical protein
VGRGAGDAEADARADDAEVLQDDPGALDEHHRRVRGVRERGLRDAGAEQRGALGERAGRLVLAGAEGEHLPGPEREGLRQGREGPLFAAITAGGRALLDEMHATGEQCGPTIWSAGAADRAATGFADEVGFVGSGAALAACNGPGLTGRRRGAGELPARRAAREARRRGQCGRGSLDDREVAFDLRERRCVERARWSTTDQREGGHGETQRGHGGQLSRVRHRRQQRERAPVRVLSV